MKGPGAGMGEYGSPAKYESKVTRAFIRSQPGTTGSGASRTPLESLDGMITPSGLHFERHHSGVPAIDPAQHRLLIHGLVKRPLIFTVDALLRCACGLHRGCGVRAGGVMAWERGRGEGARGRGGR